MLSVANAGAEARRTPLRQLAREAGTGTGLSRVLPSAAAGRIAPAMFQSSI